MLEDVEDDPDVGPERPPMDRVRPQKDYSKLSFMPLKSTFSGGSGQSDIVDCNAFEPQNKATRG